MLSGGRRAQFFLFLGDLAVFSVSLWVTLFLRSGNIPTKSVLIDHAVPFSLLFLLWVTVFYMAGLYEKRAILFKHRLPTVLFRVQLFNIVLAALFFFFIPFFGITPKTTLAIYLVVSLGLIFVWRLGIFQRLTSRATRERAAIIGSGAEVSELVAEVNNNSRYRLEFKVVCDPNTLTTEQFKELSTKFEKEKISIIVVDTESDSTRTVLPFVYDLSLIKGKYQFADFYSMYQEVFDRVPLSLLKYEWFLKNLSPVSNTSYLFARRAIDIVGGILMGLITLIATPFLFLAMRLEDGGPLFLAQERIGEGGEKVLAYKFRSMTFNDKASKDWVQEGKNKVTKVGSFLRLTSLDEFPQFLNVLRGELSLIGPRNDIEGLGKRLGDAIPYYMTRYMVRPGITGWAQINQQYEQGHISPQSIEETKMRLAYDFYYIKNRSFMLDVVIALKTFKRMLFRLSTW